jgi:hypothetical protein
MIYLQSYDRRVNNALRNNFQHFRRDRATLTKPQHPSTTFFGKNHQEWSAEEQQRLELAVKEVALRSSINPPGPRAIQIIMTARARGNRELDGEHGLRSSPASGTLLADRFP